MTAPPPPPAALPLWRRLLRWGWLALVLAFLAVVLRERGGQVAEALTAVSPVAVLAALAASAASVGVSGALWRGLLAGLGARLPWRAAVRVFFVGQLGKYVPGSVWPVLAQMELGRDFAVAGRVAAAGFALFMAAYLLWGAAVAGVALPVAGLLDWPWALLALAALPVLLPAALRRVLDLVMRVGRRAPLEAFPGTGAALAAGVRAVVMWLLAGLHLWLLAQALGVPLGIIGATGAFAASWAAGFLFVVAPAGAGVREAVLVALLAPVTDTATALALALLSRALVTVADAGWGVAGLLLRPRA